MAFETSDFTKYYNKTNGLKFNRNNEVASFFHTKKLNKEVIPKNVTKVRPYVVKIIRKRLKNLHQTYWVAQ